MSDLITSKDIIKKTGISRATLNNYIKMGILPKPIVGRPRPGQVGVKQIGYFPQEALDRISKMRMLKNQGFSMAEIAAEFQRGEGEATVNQQQLPQGERRKKNLSQPSNSSSGGCSASNLKVTICDINSPAYLVNHNFEIEWINKQAEDVIFKQNVRSLVDIESRNIFRLLLKQGLRSQSQSWRNVITLHFTVLQKTIDDGRIHSLFKGVGRNESEILLDLFHARTQDNQDSFFHLPITTASSDNTKKTFWVHTMTFREGTFFVFVTDDGLNSEFIEMLNQRERVINTLLRNRMPSLVTLGVLVANIQDSVKISAELLPGQYFELINGLWEAVSSTFEKYNGIYGKHAGDGMLYYFIHRHGTNYLMDSINYAIELREIMSEFSDKWRARMSWDNVLYLNIGLNEGQEFFGTIYSGKNIEFTALGDTINIAGRLSELARNGEIWTTKNLISKLSQEERNSIRFGVHHKNNTGSIFIRGSFARIGDLITEDTRHPDHFCSISGLPITVIKDKVNYAFRHR